MYRFWLKYHRKDNLLEFTEVISCFFGVCKFMHHNEDFEMNTFLTNTFLVQLSILLVTIVLCFSEVRIEKLS